MTDRLLGGWVVFLWREVGGSLFGLIEGYGFFVLLGVPCWVQRVVFGFSYFSVFVFALLGSGPSCPLCWSGLCFCSGV